MSTYLASTLLLIDTVKGFSLSFSHLFDSNLNSQRSKDAPARLAGEICARSILSRARERTYKDLILSKVELKRRFDAKPNRIKSSSHSNLILGNQKTRCYGSCGFAKGVLWWAFSSASRVSIENATLRVWHQWLSG